MKKSLRVFRCWIFVLLALLTEAPLFAGITAADPNSFFTTVASRLLASEMNLNLARIEIYPTNQYTPAVHRLLQVTANIYDATSTNYFPTVYRPLFTVDAFGDVFVSGYTNVPCVSGPSELAPPVDAVVLASTPNLPANVATNVYGVPWIIAARKGFPTFNEFVGEYIVGMTRRLQVTRVPNPSKITGTNQMYLMSLNTSGGLDFWNSYSNNFMDPVTVDYRVITWLSLTNSDATNYPGGDVPLVPQPVTSPLIGFEASNSISFTGWSGAAPWVDGQPNPNSFYVPLNFINFVNVSNSVYRTPYAGLTPGTLPLGSTAPALIWTNYFGVFGMTAVFETNLPGPTRFYIPQWGLLTTNQLQVYILDRDASGMNHVIDYVNLEQSGSENLNNEIFNDDNAGVWNTNIDPKIGVPWGIYNQILISEGLENLPPEDGVWQRDMDAEMYGTSIPVQQADFQAFFYPYGAIAYVQDGYGSAFGSNDDATVQAPYAPTRYAVGYSLLEANDPLVHYLASDLQPSFTVNIPSAFNNSISNVPPPAAEPATLGRLNYNFQPWGGNPYLDENTSFGIASSVQPDDYDLMERDPLVFGPDDWDFPTNQTLAAGWLGQVHRGTPWQTLYLKSPDILSQRIQVVDGVTNYIGTNIWSEWTGDTNLADAANMAPVEDWDVVGILAAMFNTNNFASLVSVNEPNTNAWQALLDGLTALTNTLEFPPILISSNSPQAAIIANGIESTRLGQPAHFFHDLGDFLATPQLSVQSPFLNLAATNLLTDEDYEIIPSQLLSLLRADSFGSVVSANGQTVFQFTGDDSQSYLIEASPDLVNWTIISTNQPVNGVFTFTNLAAPNAGTEFYRSVLMN